MNNNQQAVYFHAEYTCMPAAITVSADDFQDRFRDQPAYRPGRSGGFLIRRLCVYGRLRTALCFQESGGSGNQK
jgi:hypothetical protein